MSVKHKVHRQVRRLGYDIARFDPESHPLARRSRLLSSLQIDVVLDVGANAGQYAQDLRELGFTGLICSFEPMTAPFDVLRERAAGDPGWRAFSTSARRCHRTRNYQRGGQLGEQVPCCTCSLGHLEAAPDSAYVGTEEVEIKTLDSVFDDLCAPGEHVCLKIDTQGFEGRVLRGADRSLAGIGTLQVEMSLTLYVGEPTFVEISQLLLDKGYTMVGLEPGFADPRTGQLLQADGIFHRAEDPRIG